MRGTAAGRTTSRTQPDPAVPAKGAPWGRLLLDPHGQRVFAARSAWQAAPSPVQGRPKLPGDQDPPPGRHRLVSTPQARSVPALRHGRLTPCMLGSSVQTKPPPVEQARSVARSGVSGGEVVDAQAPLPAAVNPALLHAGLDRGLTTWAARAADTAGFIPRIVNGRLVKSSKPFDHKGRAELQSPRAEARTSRRLARLPTNRRRRIAPSRPTAARRIIALLVAEGRGRLVIGQNPRGKQEAHLGRRTNQHVVGVPPARFIARLRDKAALVGSRSS